MCASCMSSFLLAPRQEARHLPIKDHAAYPLFSVVSVGWWGGSKSYEHLVRVLWLTARRHFDWLRPGRSYLNKRRSDLACPGPLWKRRILRRCFCSRDAESRPPLQWSDVSRRAGLQRRRRSRRSSITRCDAAPHTSVAILANRFSTLESSCNVTLFACWNPKCIRYICDCGFGRPGTLQGSCGTSFLDGMSNR